MKRLFGSQMQTDFRFPCWQKSAATNFFTQVFVTPCWQGKEPRHGYTQVFFSCWQKDEQLHSSGAFFVSMLAKTMRYILYKHVLSSMLIKWLTSGCNSRSIAREMLILLALFAIALPFPMLAKMLILQLLRTLELVFASNCLGSTLVDLI
jgi:hypothetical protein